MAVSEVAFEQVTNKRWRAEGPPFLNRQKIEALVQLHLHHIQDSLGSALGLRLMETDILEQRRFLDELAEENLSKATSFQTLIYLVSTRSTNTDVVE